MAPGNGQLVVQWEWYKEHEIISRARKRQIENGKGRESMSLLIVSRAWEWQTENGKERKNWKKESLEIVNERDKNSRRDLEMEERAY